MNGSASAIDLDAVRQFTAAIPQLRALGAEIVSLEKGRGCVRLDWRAELVGNPITGGLHGSVITTLLDTVSGMATFAALDRIMQIATLDLRIDYLKPAASCEAVFAAAECYKMTRSVAFVRGHAYQDGGGDIAASLATFMLGSSPLPGRANSA